ncbi:tetratricopeptide repeat protein [Planctomycetota bacterium]
MKTQCIHCKASFKVQDEHVGKTVTCPKCKEKFLIIPSESLQKSVAKPDAQKMRPAPPSKSEDVPTAKKEAPGSDQMIQTVPTEKQPRKKIGILGIVAIALGFIACIVITVFITRLTGRITDDEINKVGSEVTIQEEGRFADLVAPATKEEAENQPTVSLPESDEQPKESKPLSPLVTLVKKIQPAVVMIITYDKDNEPSGLGSGFFIDQNGLLITNYHVLEGAVRAEVKTHDGNIYPISLVVAENQDVDLIKVWVDISSQTVRFVPLSKEVPDVAERVMVVGNPEGLEQTVSEGIISAVRDIPILGKIYQITAPISSGSSGSPVANMEGQVIGVATFQMIEGQNLNFAVSGEQVLALKSEKKNITLAEWTFGVSQQKIDEARELYETGLSFLWLDKYEKALDNFKKAAEKNPRYENAFLNIGWCFGELGRHLEAIEAYKQAIRINSDYADAHYNLGVAYGKLGRYQEAIEANKQAIRINPDDAKAHYNLGVDYSDLGRHQEAIEVLKEAIRIKPDFAEAHLNLGNIYSKIGRHQEAIETYKQAIRIKPDYALAHLNLGVNYLLIGDKKSALDEYKILLELDKDFAKTLFDLIYNNNHIIPDEDFIDESTVTSKATNQNSNWEYFEETTISSTISGSIKRGHILKTTSGGIYEVAEYVYLYEYEYSPDVLILHNGNLFKLIIEGFDEPLICKRLNPIPKTNQTLTFRTLPVIESYIDSDFDGIEYGNIYVLANGQIWEQTEAYPYPYPYPMPKVIIWNSGGVYKMKVEKIDRPVTVRRIK